VTRRIDKRIIKSEMIKKAGDGVTGNKAAGINAPAIK
jgi:hypothetical protein